jgi:hypothetical protein
MSGCLALFGASARHCSGALREPVLFGRRLREDRLPLTAEER